jgi:hypothetical protein
VKVGSGASSICGDNSGALTWRQLGSTQDAVYADVDTASCSFPDVPVYVASLVESEPQGGSGGGDATKAATAAQKSSGVSRSAGSVTVTAHAVGSFRVVLWDPQFVALPFSPTLPDAMAARRWTVDWVGDTGANSGVTLAGQTEWKEMPADTAAAAQGKDDQGEATTREVTDKNAGVLYVDVDTRACGFDTAPAYFVSLNGVDALSTPLLGANAGLGNSMAAVHGVEFFRTQGASMVYAARAGGFRVYVRVAHLTEIADASLRVGVVNDLKWTLSWIGVDRATLAGGGPVGGMEGVGEDGGGGFGGAARGDEAGDEAAPATWRTASGSELVPGARPPLFADVPTARSGFKVIPTYVSALTSDAPFAGVFVGGLLATDARFNGYRLFVAQPLEEGRPPPEVLVTPGDGIVDVAKDYPLAPDDLRHWRVDYFGYDGLPSAKQRRGGQRGAGRAGHGARGSASAGQRRNKRAALLGGGGGGLVGSAAAALAIGDEHGLRIDRVRARVRTIPLEGWLVLGFALFLLWYKKHLAVQSQERLYHRRRRRRNLDECTVNPNATMMRDLAEEEEKEMLGADMYGTGDKVRRRSNPASGKKRESLKAIRNAFSRDEGSGRGGGGGGKSSAYGHGGEPRRESERRISDMEGGGARRRSGARD